MSAAEYIDSGMPIEGWFLPLDARLMVAVDDWQRALGVTGDLLEIGAYLGKSTVLIGYFAREAERVHVVDLFEDSVPTIENKREYDRFYVGLTADRFQANYRRFHQTPPIIHQGLSGEQLTRLDAETFRFIHIDGSHSYDIVCSDIVDVRRLVRPGAIVVFDDMTQRHTPGVAAAVWSAVIRQGLRPLALTSKLYATWDPDIDGRAFTGRASGIEIVDEHEVAGHTFVEVIEPSPENTALRRLARRWVPPALVPIALRLAPRRHR